MENENPARNKVWDILENTDRNVFIYGPAGTGKSTLLREYVALLEEEDLNYVVTAPTGIAAINVGGETIHHMMHLGGTVTPEHVKKNRTKISRERREFCASLDVMIIDEISMVRADLFDALNEYMNITRGSNLPFGGVRLVCFGDLFQLPPVCSRAEEATFREFYAHEYFFASEVFYSMATTHLANMYFCELSHVYRQHDDEFIHVLHRVRDGSLSAADLALLNTRVISGRFDPANLDDSSTVLTTTRRGADNINSIHMRRIPDQPYTYKGHSTGNYNERDFPTPINLVLKPGARVMLLSNDPKNRWVNGSMGAVYQCFEDYVDVRLDNGQIVDVHPFTWEDTRAVYDREQRKIIHQTYGTYEQLPIKPAWAVTIHKAQGLTFDKLTLDLSRPSFAAGQTYVALSRVTSLEGLILTKPITMADIICNQRVIEYYQCFSDGGDGERILTTPLPPVPIRAGEQALLFGEDGSVNAAVQTSNQRRAQNRVQFSPLDTSALESGPDAYDDEGYYDFTDDDCDITLRW